MFPVERFQRIKELLQQEKTLKITDLSKKLDVSEMTIHRDLKPLIEDGTAFKTFGGVTLKETTPTHSANLCVYCSRPIQEKVAYKLILLNNETETMCCAHCGLLRQRQLGDSVIQAICSDFLKQTTISAHSASFVMDTTLDLGCCQPQALTFEWEEHARRFIRGFDGKVYSLQAAMDKVFTEMQTTPCDH